AVPALRRRAARGPRVDRVGPRRPRRGHARRRLRARVSRRHALDARRLGRGAVGDLLHLVAADRRAAAAPRRAPRRGVPRRVRRAVRVLPRRRRRARAAPLPAHAGAEAVTLELWQADGASAALEEYLAGESLRAL